MLLKKLSINERVFPVILCGGVGLRMWPISCEQVPKQFLKIGNEHSLFQKTALGVASKSFYKPIIVTNRIYKDIVKSELEQIGIYEYTILLENESKNTAFTSLMSAFYIDPVCEDAAMFILASDHHMSSDFMVDELMINSKHLVKDHIIMFGIEPSGPRTEYGYIKLGKNIINKNACRIESFKEKPNALDAQKFLLSGDYLWNSGNFLTSTKNYLSVFKKLAPEIVEYCHTLFQDQVYTQTGKSVIDIEYRNSKNHKNQSIDDVLENDGGESLLVYRLKDSGWPDLGFWQSHFDISYKDADDNFITGNVLSDNVQSSYIFNNDKPMMTVGVENLIIVNTNDALLIADRSRLDLIKKNAPLAQKIVAIHNAKKDNLKRVAIEKPWGHYEVLDEGINFKVKQIVVVRPGQEISLQKHYQRAEHWIVVSGSGMAQVGCLITKINMGDHLYIPKGSQHTLKNIFKRNILQLVEVQLGRPCEEDIVRLSDKYNRCKNQDKI